MQPDSLAGIGNQLGKTFTETCQVLIFIDCHQSLRYPVQTWQVLLEPTKPDSLAGIGNQLGKTFAETCQVLIFRLSPEPTLPSSNLTGLTRAYTTRLVCRDR